MKQNLKEPENSIRREIMSEAYSQYPWLFNGAYAKYEGTLGKFEATAKVEVVDIDLSNRRAKFRVKSNVIRRAWRLRTKVGGKEIAEWARIGERVILSEEAILDGEYDGVVRVEDLGVRRCIVQQYSEGLNTTVVFWDKEFNWPLKYVLIFRHEREDSDEIFDFFKACMHGFEDMLDFATGGLLKVELKKSKSKALRERSLILYLKETNIPGLEVTRK